MGWRMAKYVETLFRHRLRFLLLLLILPAGLQVACVVAFPHMSAVSSLWVDTPAYISGTSAASGWSQYLTPAQNTVDALNQLRSTHFFVKKLRTSLDAANTFESASERDTVLGTVTSDTVVTATGSHLVVLRYTCPHQPICTNVLSSTIEIYHQWLADQQAAQAKVAIDFYSGQLAIAKAKLASDEAALAAYVATHPSFKTVDAPLIPEFDQLIRNVDHAKSAVATFQQKLDDTKLTDAAVGQLDSTVLKTVDAPRTVGGRLNALPKKQMTITGIASLALALAVLMIMVWSDRSTREPKDIESRLRIPVAVTIPDLNRLGRTIG
jgi:capsular polysaccharide biosynthesis protein